MNNIEVSFNQTLVSLPSTQLIETMKICAIEYARQMGRGMTLRLDVISNKECSNCNVFIEKLRVD